MTCRTWNDAASPSSPGLWSCVATMTSDVKSGRRVASHASAPTSAATGEDEDAATAAPSAGAATAASWAGAEGPASASGCGAAASWTGGAVATAAGCAAAFAAACLDLIVLSLALKRSLRASSLPAVASRGLAATLALRSRLLLSSLPPAEGARRAPACALAGAAATAAGTAAAVAAEARRGACDGLALPDLLEDEELLPVWAWELLRVEEGAATAVPASCPLPRADVPATAGGAGGGGGRSTGGLWFVGPCSGKRGTAGLGFGAIAAHSAGGGTACSGPLTSAENQSRRAPRGGAGHPGGSRGGLRRS